MTNGLTYKDGSWYSSVQRIQNFPNTYYGKDGCSLAGTIGRVY